MKTRLLRFARYLIYPAFYVFCLVFFGYLTFPFGLLKDRLIAEFARAGKPGQRLEIDKLSSYWFSGIEFTNAKIVMPPDEPTPGFGYSSGGDFGGGLAAATPPKESVIAIEEGHARVRLLPLLIGRVRLDFWASAMGGEIRGTVPVSGSNGDVEIELTRIDINKIEPLGHALGIPLKGTASGKLVLTAPDGKLSKANGSLDISVEGIVVSEENTKIQGIIELPPARAGTLTLTAEAKDGLFKVTKLAALGPDIELVGDGRITAKEPWNDSNADLYLRFKFSDAYRGKNETTKSLLGDPGSTLPGIIEIQVPKMKRAKRADGFFGWHMHGPLKNPKFDPSTADAGPAGPPTAGKASKKEWKKPGLTPLGPSSATKPDEVPAIEPPPAPPPMRAPPEMEPIRGAPPEITPPPAPPPPPMEPTPRPVEQPPVPELQQPPTPPEQPAPPPP